MGRDEKNKKNLSGAQRVKQHRQWRREVGLTELRAWIRESDLSTVNKLLQPFRKIARNTLKDAKMEEIKSNCEYEV